MEENIFIEFQKKKNQKKDDFCFYQILSPGVAKKIK